MTSSWGVRRRNVNALGFLKAMGSGEDSTVAEYFQEETAFPQPSWVMGVESSVFEKGACRGAGLWSRC